MEEDKLLYLVKEIRFNVIRVMWLVIACIGCILHLSYANAASYKDMVGENQQEVEKQKTLYQSLIEINKKEVSKLEPEHSKIIKQTERAFNEHANNIEAKKGTILDEIINNIKNLESEEKRAKNKGILIFVSFSMPKNLLWSYQELARLYGARVIIRGLVDNDFKKTVQAMDLGDGNIMTLEVNPMLFKDYRINRVPSVVIVGDDSFIGPEDKFTGTISLNYVLEESIARGHQKEFSAKKLREIKERGSK